MVNLTVQNLILQQVREGNEVRIKIALLNRLRAEALD